MVRLGSLNVGAGASAPVARFFRMFCGIKVQDALQILCAEVTGSQVTSFSNALVLYRYHVLIYEPRNCLFANGFRLQR